MGVNLHLLLNCTDYSGKINDRLLRLRTYYFSENLKKLSKINKSNVVRLSKYIAKIHSYNIMQDELPIYDTKWAINLVSKNVEDEYTKDIINALEIMSKIENYTDNINLTIKNNKFLTWNIKNEIWQETYEKGYIGNYTWDIAAIINYVNNSKFSDIFLESYIKYSKKRPTLVELYSNIYYVQVVTAVLSRNVQSIIPTTQKIIFENIFDTEIISYDTLIRLNITGYK